MVTSEAAAGLAFAGARRWRRVRDPLQSWGRSVRHRLGLEADPRTLARRPGWAQGTRSSLRINELLSIAGSARYLEIGVEHGLTLEAVRAKVRIAVDPRPMFRADRLPRGVHLHARTSDEFFAAEPVSTSLNGAFIDGLHEFQQTYQDLIAALDRLVPGGFALVDDVVPIDEVAALPSEEEFRQAADLLGDHSGAWMGDVWRVVLALDRFHSDELDWRTATARNGRMQTLVWRRPGARLTTPTRGDLSELTGESVAIVLGSSLPEAFKATTWAQAVTAFGIGRLGDRH